MHTKLITALTLAFAGQAVADDVIFLAADPALKAQESLDTWIAEDLADAFQLDCRILTPNVEGSFAGLQALPDTELLVISANAHTLSPENRALLEAYAFSGKPMVILGNGCRAFAGWQEFSEGFAAVNDLGAWDQHGSPSVRRLESANDHPIVAGLDVASLSAHGPLQRVTPLFNTATPLFEGRVAGVREAEPVAWTSGYRGSRIFVTTLGTPADFAEPVFRPMITRAVFWCLDRRNLDGDEAVPLLEASNSVSIFDGESLEGWTNHGGRYDGNALWTVEDGAIVGRQGPGKSGGLLYTNRPYKNFIVAFETRIDYPFDSGVFLHMVPRDGGKGIQVTLDYRPGGQIGGIYADGYLQQNPDSTDLLKRDEWNRVVVRCIDDDMHVTAWVNDQLVMDYVTPAGTEGFAPTGLIGIQVHGGEDVPDSQRAMFRNLRIRELPHYDSELFQVDDRGILSLTAAGEQAGWKALFNGKDLAGWDPRPSAEGYVVREGELVFPSQGGDGEIRSLGEYQDFELRLDFQISRMANSGLFLRAAPNGNPAFSGCEIQILDDFNWETVTNSTLQPYQFTGGLYGALPPKIKTALRPLGDWNTYQVRYVGSRISVRLNDYLLYDVDTHTLENAKPPFAERASKGFIGLQRHAPGGVETDFAKFRNLFVKEIPSK